VTHPTPHDPLIAVIEQVVDDLVPRIRAKARADHADELAPTHPDAAEHLRRTR